MEFISVKKEWPDMDEGRKILCIDMNQKEDAYIFEAECDDGVWTNICGDEFTHWMTRPELPLLESK